MISLLTVFGLIALVIIFDYAQGACSTVRTSYTSRAGERITIHDTVWCRIGRAGSVSFNLSIKLY